MMGIPYVLKFRGSRGQLTVLPCVGLPSCFSLNLYDLLQVETMLAIEFALDVC